MDWKIYSHLLPPSVSSATPLSKHSYLAVDPGARSAAVIVVKDGVVWLHKSFTSTDALHLFGPWALKKYGALDWAVIEHVHAWPGRGVVSTWTFAESYGALLCTAHFLVPLPSRIIQVPPRKWQAAIFRTQAEHADSRLAAMRLFPWLRDWMRYKKDHNTADALCLLAWLVLYGARETPRR